MKKTLVILNSDSIKRKLDWKIISRIDEKWWRVNWLLKWKTAKIYATCDAPWLFYKIFPIRLSWLWWFARLWFCGVKLTKFKLIDKMRKKSENELNVILEQIYAENK